MGASAEHWEFWGQLRAWHTGNSEGTGESIVVAEAPGWGVVQDQFAVPLARALTFLGLGAVEVSDETPFP